MKDGAPALEVEYRNPGIDRSVARLADRTGVEEPAFRSGEADRRHPAVEDPAGALPVRGRAVGVTEYEHSGVALLPGELSELLLG
jgi:hypothetical protein